MIKSRCWQELLLKYSYILGLCVKEHNVIDIPSIKPWMNRLPQVHDSSGCYKRSFFLTYNHFQWLLKDTKWLQHVIFLHCSLTKLNWFLISQCLGSTITEKHTATTKTKNYQTLLCVDEGINLSAGMWNMEFPLESTTRTPNISSLVLWCQISLGVFYPWFCKSLKYRLLFILFST